MTRFDEKKSNNLQAMEAGIMKRILLTVLCISASFLCGAAFSDVIVFNNGDHKEGIVQDVKGNENVILFIDSTGQVQIGKDRLLSVNKEEPYKGYLEIGNQYFDRGDYDRALEQYAKAKELKPDAQDVADRIALAKAQIERKKAELLKQRSEEISALIEEARSLAKKQSFDESVKALKRAESLNPSADQGEEIHNALAESYYLWGISRMDRVNKEGAAELFEQALKYDPKHQEAYDKLIELWSSDPTKLDQVIAVYKQRLVQNPNDMSLKLKLAKAYYDKKNYEDALPLYIELYKSGQVDKTVIAERLDWLFKQLHTSYAQRQQYEKAIQYYKLYMETMPNVDPSVLYIYEYADRSLKLKPGDIKGRTALAYFARENHLDAQARKEFERVIQLDPENAEALKGLNLYAEDALREAQFFFDQKQYSTATDLAKKIFEDYPRSKEVAQKETELISKAENEMRREARLKQKEAAELVTRGDEYYAQAQGHIAAMKSSEINRNVYILSDKEEAKKYLRRAIYCWETALKTDPSLGSLATGDLRNKLRDSRQQLYVLENPVPMPMPPTTERTWH
jgi:tetratricopeptide (TPR) repeat protein